MTTAGQVHAGVFSRCDKLQEKDITLIFTAHYFGRQPGERSFPDSFLK